MILQLPQYQLGTDQRLWRQPLVERGANGDGSACGMTGNEHGVEPLSTCSVVVAPVQVEGEHLGTIGVLGPTRMNYPRALAAVEVVSDRLGKRLAEG